MPVDRDAPVLWHLELSHYNEKVRWALDHKPIDRRRRALVPVAHTVVARRLTRGACATTPVLTLDGEAIGESAAIIDALERRWPDPPLYPEDPQLRDRALALQEYFGAEVGPHIRRARYVELLDHPAVLRPVFTHGQPPVVRALFGAAFPFVRRLMRRALRITPDGARRSRERVIAAIDRLDDELARGDGEHLVGDRFSVADLTAASLLYPLVGPPEFPYPLPALAPDPLDEALRDRPGVAWVARTYARYRVPR